MRGGVTDAGKPNEQTISEDRATQPIEAGGWVSQLFSDSKTVWLSKRGIEATTEAVLFNWGQLCWI